MNRNLFYLIMLIFLAMNLASCSDNNLEEITADSTENDSSKASNNYTGNNNSGANTNSSNNYYSGNNSDYGNSSSNNMNSPSDEFGDTINNEGAEPGLDNVNIDPDTSNNSSNSNPETEIEPEPEPEPEPLQDCSEESISLFISADDSNSQASPVVARKIINNGKYVSDKTIRTYEFLNYADFAYEPAPKGELAIYPELRAKADLIGQYDFQIGVRAHDIERNEARPLNLVLILDTSGSMAGPPIKLVKETVNIIKENLISGDIISVVTLSAESKIVVNGCQAESFFPETEVFPELIPNGVTDLESALRLAYEVANEHKDANKLNRVILISDGGANAGVTEKELIAQNAGTAESEGIYMAGVGVGEGFNDKLMDAVTDEGKGAYFFIDSIQEAHKMFGDRFVANLELAALNVRTELIIPGNWKLVKFHGEEVSTNPEEVKTQNLSPNDQLIFNQVIGTCAPSDVTGEEIFKIKVYFTEAETGTAKTQETEITLQEMIDSAALNLKKGNALVEFAETIKELYPLRNQKSEAINLCNKTKETLGTFEDDADIDKASELLTEYCNIMENGEKHEGACDCSPNANFAQSLGICNQGDANLSFSTPANNELDSWGVITSLYESDSIHSREGCSMGALSSGIVGESITINGGANSCGYGSDQTFTDPIPEFSGENRNEPDDATICDNTKVEIELTAPSDAKSFSFDFIFFSAEYPDFIGSAYNDTFYAILKAESTNNSKSTNISFDAFGNAIEINNNYFANPFHPCSEQGTGFVNRASTCWLRTSWPIEPGETFKLIFSVHDEGDAIYSSTVLLDNLKFHDFPAVGMTDPIN